jgi:F-type H+-transporting ATPase subunit gamma
MQINGTKNIRKITASMKMVSAAKLKGDENRLQAAKPFNGWTSAVCTEPKEIEFATYEELPQKTLIVPFTSEKGLCGGVNSFVTRGVKTCLRHLKAQGKTADVVVIGDKGRGQLRRTHGEFILRSATDVHAPANFALASALTTEIMAAGAADYDAVLLMFNSYVNAAVYKQKYKVIFPFVYEGAESTLDTYEFDSDKVEALADLYEYMLASQVFHCFMDGAAAEQSARMTAMENATKNAGEMINSLTL